MPQRAGNRVASVPARAVSLAQNLDIGEVDEGHHLVVLSIVLRDKFLLFDYEYRPELTGEEDRIWPNINYGADVAPPGWNHSRSDAEVYERPVPEARYAWFDFFLTDYEWTNHLDRHGPDDDYLRNRVSRLTVDLKTGETQIEK